MTGDAPVTRAAEERRLGPVSEWFGPGRVNYLVLHRAQLQAMPLDWQKEFCWLLEELFAAYGGQPPTDFQVTPAEYLELSGLTPAQLAQARIAVDEGPDGLPRYTGPDGVVMRGGDTVPVPVADPVPYYRHAWLAPDEEAIAARVRRGRAEATGR
jgi:hypothetical protein